MWLDLAARLPLVSAPRSLGGRGLQSVGMGWKIVKTVVASAPPVTQELEGAQKSHGTTVPNQRYQSLY